MIARCCWSRIQTAIKQNTLVRLKFYSHGRDVKERKVLSINIVLFSIIIWWLRSKITPLRLFSTDFDNVCEYISTLKHNFTHDMLHHGIVMNSSKSVVWKTLSYEECWWKKQDKLFHDVSFSLFSCGIIPMVLPLPALRVLTPYGRERISVDVTQRTTDAELVQHLVTQTPLYMRWRSGSK